MYKHKSITSPQHPGGSRLQMKPPPSSLVTGRVFISCETWICHFVFRGERIRKLLAWVSAFVYFLWNVYRSECRINNKKDKMYQHVVFLCLRDVGATLNQDLKPQRDEPSTEHERGGKTGGRWRRGELQADLQSTIETLVTSMNFSTLEHKPLFMNLKIM